MSVTLRQRLIAIAFGLWVAIVLALYIGSFGPVIRMLILTLMP